MDKYIDVIQSMTEAKYNTPLLVQTINHMLNINIQKGAVDAAIQDITAANNLSNVQETKYNQQELLVRQLAMNNLYTLVAYPCSYHFDVFKQNQYSLENKICFSFRPTLFIDELIGRGGGDEVCCVALLDWTNSSEGQRRRQYIASGGSLKPNEKVTQSKWNKQFGNK